MSENLVKENIIQATISLIEKSENFKDITVRSIAESAGVGVGLINYHFQSKSNLITICINRMMETLFKKVSRKVNGLELAPLDKIRFMAKSNLTFVAENRVLSKASLMNEFLLNQTNDTTSLLHEEYFRIAKEYYGEGFSNQEVLLNLHMLFSSFQTTFLRHEFLKKHLNIDFYNKEQREQFIDLAIERIIVK